MHLSHSHYEANVYLCVSPSEGKTGQGLWPRFGRAVICAAYGEGEGGGQAAGGNARGLQEQVGA